MKRIILFILLFLNMKISSNAQSSAQTFDFWLGKWDAHWNDSLKGTNIITKTLNDLVVEENFAFNDGTFKGRSWSVFNPATKMWQQTWVDDSGAYLVFTGGQSGDNVVLNMTEPRTAKGKTVYMRMVFSDIKKDSFSWDWESSEDKMNWKNAWAIKYKRK